VYISKGNNYDDFFQIGPGGLLYLPISIGLIGFFNYYYTFLQVVTLLII
jgi:hypothetical protein